MARLLGHQHRVRQQVFTNALRPVLTVYSTRWHERREEEIVERAMDFDVVQIITSPGARLNRRLCRLGRPRVFMDICDAPWLPLFRRSGWHDFEIILGEVHGVTCENECVADYARRHNSRVFVVPDAPQVEVFDRFRGQVQRDPEKLVIGWIGSPLNIGHLYKIYEPLEALFARHPQLHLRLVGASEPHLPRFESVRWSCRPNSYTQEEMVREVLSFDVGLFPLHHNEDGRARGTLKAMVYMSGEAVAVCEHYGENPKLIQDGINGMLANSPQEWYEKLEWLITHPAERQAIAQRGLETIRQRFTAEHVFAQLLAVFERV